METKKLYRSRKDKIIFGVCGGIAEYFEIDPVIIRLVFLLLGLSGGVGIVIYIIGAIIIPEEALTSSKKSESSAEDIKDNVQKMAKEIKANIKQNKSRYSSEEIFGILLIVFGVLFLIDRLFSWFKFWQLWPVVLIILGILLIGKQKKE